jgi:putative sigma-54 modulation protein
MIHKLEIAGVHMEVNDDLRKYVFKKIGKLDKYMPKSAREAAHVEVKLKERTAKGKNERTCEVVVYLPKEAITVVDTTINMYAAVDIAEEKLKARLRKYKSLHDTPHLKQRLLGRFSHRSQAAAEQL